MRRDFSVHASCPRCHDPLPVGYPGAMSRMEATRATLEICSLCGMDEAMRDVMGMSPIPPGEWPTKHEEVTLQVQAEIDKAKQQRHE